MQTSKFLLRYLHIIDSLLLFENKLENFNFFFKKDSNEIKEDVSTEKDNKTDKSQKAGTATAKPKCK